MSKKDVILCAQKKALDHWLNDEVKSFSLVQVLCFKRFTYNCSR